MAETTCDGVGCGQPATVVQVQALTGTTYHWCAACAARLDAHLQTCRAFLAEAGFTITPETTTNG